MYRQAHLAFGHIGELPSESQHFIRGHQAWKGLELLKDARKMLRIRVNDILCHRL